MSIGQFSKGLVIMDDGIKWRDHAEGSTAFIELQDGTMRQLSVDGPSKYCQSWTAEASLLDADFRQIKYSGLLNGGGTREMAKDAALIALEKIAGGKVRK